MDIIILGVTCLTNFILGAIVFFQNPRGGVQRSFGLMILMVCLWIISNYLSNNPYNNSLFFADIANKLAFTTGILIIFSGLLFTYFFPVRQKPRKIETITQVSLMVIISVLSLTTLVSGEVSYNSSGALTFSIGELLWLWGLIYAVTVGIIIKKMVSVGGLQDTRIKRRALYVMLSFAISAAVGLLLNIILPLVSGEWHTTRFGPLSTIILVGSITYLIARQGLFDIKWVAVRATTYAGSLLTLACFYYLFAYLFSVAVFSGGSRNALIVSPVNIALALGLAFLFQPIKRFFDRTTNSIFYRQQYNSEEFFARFSELLSSTTDLRGLLERASHQLATTFKADQAFFFVYYADETVSHHMSAGTTGHSRLTIDDARLLDDYISQTNATIFMVDFMTDNLRVRRLLKQHHISVVMTLRHGDTTTGYVFLGEHLSGAFTKRDLNVLSTVSNELVIAIQNALSLQELKDLNATLKQRIDVATKQLRASNAQLKRLDQVKDEFMSMASHQLRTPLTSIKGYLSMVLEGDAGKLTAQQRKLLVEAFNSSERMVRLIADFLNVSRLQTGKFVIDKTPFDIGEAVRQETANLQLIAESHTMRLHLDLESTPLSVVADEQKIRQVVMNLIDNAIYYSHPNSIILVKVERIGDDASFTVTDTGIGIAEKDQPKLFTKFFRAENARKQRPDGTGVGLYLARRVVGAHDGKIILRSIEGRGSTFGFQLPLAPKNGGGK